MCVKKNEYRRIKFTPLFLDKFQVFFDNHAFKLVLTAFSGISGRPSYASLNKKLQSENWRNYFISLVNRISKVLL